jgi:O-antigen ligase
VQLHKIPNRARQSAIVLLAALAAVLVIHLTFGLSDVLLFGLVGGIVGSLVVIGLDLLRNAQRKMDAALAAQPKPDDTGEVRR